MTTLFITANQLKANVLKVFKHLPDSIEVSLAHVGSAIITDAIEQTPKVPVRTGHLRASHFVNVSGKDTQRGGETGATGIPKQGFTGEREMYVGFNTPYAVYVHNLKNSYKETLDAGAGPKFLVSKLTRNKSKYLKILQTTTRKSIDALANKLRGARKK